jgi:hypothetical protein
MEGATGSEMTSAHEGGTYIIIGRVSSLSGNVRAGVNCPIRALEEKPIPTENKIVTYRSSHLWKQVFA